MMLERQKEGIAKAKAEGRYRAASRRRRLKADEARRAACRGEDAHRDRQGPRDRPWQRLQGHPVGR